MNEQVEQRQFSAPRLDELRETLAACAAAPKDEPHGLPGVFYNDPAYFEHECATLLRRGWHCVGRADEFREQGDYLTLTLLGEPIIVVRDGDQIKALSNLCRHRGMPLAEGQGNANRFVCRYHAWTYGTDGALLRAPRMKNAQFDPKACKLGSFACEQRFGFVYVTLSPDAVDLDQHLSGLDALIGRYEPQNYAIVHSASEVWNCNWKALVENFMEGYHLSVVHPQTLHGYTPTGLSRKGPSGAGFTSYFANYPENIPPRGEGAAVLSQEERQRSTLFAAFPCQVVSVAASLLVSLSIRPLSATTIDVRWSMSVFGDSLDGDTIDQRIALWEAVNLEDREKLEAMQSALTSIYATGGPLAEADYEGTVHDFLCWLAAQDADLI